VSSGSVTFDDEATALRGRNRLAYAELFLAPMAMYDRETYGSEEKFRH
jgi:hypothetical protein